MADEDDVNLSSDEDYGAITKKKRKAKATSSTHEPAVKKKKGPKAKKARSRKAKYYDDSEDDFDDEPESMEEEYGSSDGEEIPIARNDLAEISSDESDDGYDADLYRDGADRVALAQMTDIERQAILYERAEKRNQIKERNSLKAQLRAVRGLPAATKGAKKVATAPKRGSRATTEVTPARPVSGKKAALNALKEKRLASAGAGQAKGTKKGDEDEDGEYNPSMEVSKPKAPPKETARAARLRVEAEAREQRVRDRHRVDSDEETDASSHDIVYDESGKRIPLLAEVDQKDLMKMVVKRDELVNWTTSEFWEKTIKGTFIRDSLGADSSGNPIYRLCEILDFNPEGKTYTVPVGPNRPPRTLSMSLKIAIGGTTRDHTIDLISNGRITDEEFNDWVERVKAQNLALPTKKTALRVANQIQKARNYVRTDADYEREMKRAEALRTNSSHSSVDLRAARDSQSDMVVQINRRNRGVNSTVEAAYTPESAEESANNPFARLPTLTTTLGSKTSSSTPNKAATSSSSASNGTPTPDTSALGAKKTSSFTLDMDVSRSSGPGSSASQSATSRGPSSYHTHTHGGRAGPSTPSLMPAPRPAKVLSFAQYLNRR